MKLFDQLQAITEELKEDTDISLLVRCGEFFMDHGQFEKAMNLFILAKKFNDAIDLAITQKVKP